MLVHLALQTDCRLVPINIYRCLPLFRVSNSSIVTMSNSSASRSIKNSGTVNKCIRFGIF